MIFLNGFRGLPKFQTNPLVHTQGRVKVYGAQGFGMFRGWRCLELLHPVLIKAKEHHVTCLFMLLKTETCCALFPSFLRLYLEK